MREQALWKLSTALATSPAAKQRFPSASSSSEPLILHREKQRGRDEEPTRRPDGQELAAFSDPHVGFSAPSSVCWFIFLATNRAGRVSTSSVVGKREDRRS